LDVIDKEQIVHNTVIEMVFENQRSSVLNNFSSENLQKNDKCGPWSNRYGVPCSKEDVKLPKSNEWFWMTDWIIDLKSPNVNKQDGWQYAKSFEEKPDSWYNEPIKGISSIVGCVRRRIWIRIRKRKYVPNNTINNNSTNYIDEGTSSFNYNNNDNNNYNNNYNNNNNNNNDNNNNLSVNINKSNLKGKNVIQSDSIENDESINNNSEIGQYLLKAKDIVNEEEYSWDYISKNELNLSIIENQFNKYTEAIEYLLKINKGILQNFFFFFFFFFFYVLIIN